MCELNPETVHFGAGSFIWRRIDGPLEGVFSLPPDNSREVQLIVPDRPAVVFGSTTRADSFSTSLLARGGYEMVRRTSGGGAVIVTPSDQLWLNVHLQRDDPLVDNDIARSFLWLGERIARAIVRLVGPSERVEMVRERAPATELSRMICFAGLGFGEVSVGGKKVVGLAQRRTRSQVTYHVAVLVTDLQSQLLEFLERPPKRVTSVGAAGLSCWGVTQSQLENALLAEFS